MSFELLSIFELNANLILLKEQYRKLSISYWHNTRRQKHTKRYRTAQ